MNKRATTPLGIAVMTAFALSCVGLLIFLYLAFGGSTPLQPKGYRADVSFTDATALAVQADVRVAGVPVGKVVEKRLDPAGNRTLATIELDARYAPLRTDARAALRQKTLLGETYVELTLGDRDAEAIPEGGRLSDDNVEETVEFDELLRIFDPDTKVAFRQWQASAARAGRGRGQDLNDALGNLPRFAENAAGVVGVLRARQDTLAELVRSTGATFEAITRNEAALQGFITDSEVVFGTLSARRDALSESVRIFPTFLRESRRTLTRLSRFSRDTTPVVEDLEDVLEDLPPTVRSLGAASPDLRGLFDALPALIRAGDRGFPALSRVLRGLRPTLAATGPLLAELNPILEFLELQQPTVSDFLGTGPSALALKIPPPPGSQSNGHVLPQLIVAGSQTLPAAQRTPDNRGNSYLPPGALASGIADPSKFAIPSFDCNHVGGPKPPTSTPGCSLAPDVTFQGTTTRYPQVRRALPGGVSRQQRPETGASSGR